jgi:hypothetical protein
MRPSAIKGFDSDMAANRDAYSRSTGESSSLIGASCHEAPNGVEASARTSAKSRVSERPPVTGGIMNNVALIDVRPPKLVEVLADGVWHPGELEAWREQQGRWRGYAQMVCRCRHATLG